MWLVGVSSFISQKGMKSVLKEEYCSILTGKYGLYVDEKQIDF